MSTAPGIGWATAPVRVVRRPRRWRTGWITCGSCASCRTRPEASPDSSCCRTSETTIVKHRHWFDSLRTLAVARLYLDNFDHITAYWVGLGMNLAQVALNYGADDVHGTIIEEKIFHMAGAGSPQLQTEKEMIRAIREAGRVPVQRDTFYRPIREWQEEALATA